MRLAQRSIKRLWLISSILILVLFFSIAFSPILLPHLSTKTHPTLPGQQRWKQGVSSFLFGTNDAYEWSSQNIQTQPAIQTDLRRAGFTLMRSFFPDHASDAVIEQHIHTIEKSGAQCLAVMTNILYVPYDSHLVRVFV